MYDRRQTREMQLSQSQKTVMPKLRSLADQKHHSVEKIPTQSIQNRGHMNKYKNKIGRMFAHPPNPSKINNCGLILTLIGGEN
jgi:hypothetical protein